ncbi:MAG TPA: hypothetical protein VFK47_15545 [Ktedonobacteraceae bacterium]|nr:hypothetical protein [Ktedonobacteraceae bacterium]
MVEFEEESYATLWSHVDQYGTLWIIMNNYEDQIFEIFTFGFGDNSLVFEGQANSLAEAVKHVEGQVSEV